MLHKVRGFIAVIRSLLTCWQIMEEQEIWKGEDRYKNINWNVNDTDGGYFILITNDL